MQKIKRKYNLTLSLIISILFIISIYIISSFFYFRIDLTSEKRFTLAPETKKVLKQLDDILYFKVYLEGDLNIPFRKIKKSIKETLDEFKVYAKNNLEYEFIDPYNNDEQEKNKVINEMANKGLKPFDIRASNKKGKSESTIIFPGAVLIYKDKQLPINFLQNIPGLSSDEKINRAITNIEYELLTKILIATSTTIDKIAFIEGHGELDEINVYDIMNELRNFFQVDRGIIGGQLGILDEYKAVIIAQPTKAFDEKDKLVLDQYLMNGGKVLWFFDAVKMSHDSLKTGHAIALKNELNIDDLLFKYGIRVNSSLIKDIQCTSIKIEENLVGDITQKISSQWMYYPKLSSPSRFKETKGLGLIKSEFVSSIDIIPRTNLISRVLLKSSNYSKSIDIGTFKELNLMEIDAEIDFKEYKSDGFPVAVQLSGQFTSAYKNRMIDRYFPDGNVPKIKEKSNSTSMLVVSDGDLIKNQAIPVPVTKSSRLPEPPPGITTVPTKINGKYFMMYLSPLGFDRFSGTTFDNKDFIMNLVNSMTGNEGLSKLRSREFEMRLLNKQKIAEERLRWQVINIVLPIVLIVCFGIAFAIIRKRKNKQLFRSVLITTDGTPNFKYSLGFNNFLLRFYAFAIDIIILSIINYYLIITFKIDIAILSEVFKPFYLITHPYAIFINWLYFASQESIFLSTIGKKIIKLKVTDVSNNKISFGRASLRYFSKYISSIIFGIGFIIIIFTKDRQALHDIFAGTYVKRID